jgi:hypothetical protein
MALMLWLVGMMTMMTTAWHVCCWRCGQCNPRVVCMMECLLQPCSSKQQAPASAVGCSHAVVCFGSNIVAAVTVTAAFYSFILLTFLGVMH